ncbi:polyprenyl synthetase family protein [Streptomyces litchfieldiae]|uniref:Polyprenyl synthetase family protein n=1 Tax=Streptomyces litchfieldiae TaxID=3075543 RepID=A0ABU2MIP6_9ACTN|nr:polyprenyl synthetase family protein [Streptomyces sp. DSM 44938]MDT0341307.1 polyprenyl synthetase family protein [Streptomyces sp. DSM 44938]
MSATPAPSDTGPRGEGAARLAATERARTLVEPELRSAVASLEPGLGRAVGYHLGWYEADGSPAEAGSGKSVRPALTLMAAAAMGAEPRAALPGAAAVELVHNFSLVHDDVMDGDAYRRHRPTLWKTFGVPTAILAGDALQSLAFITLARHEGPHTARATRCLSHTLIELATGQTLDMAFARRPWRGPKAVTVPEYRRMAEAKSGSLLGCAAEIGAILGGAPATISRAFGRAGRHLGLAFQCVDDIIGLWGDPRRTGKPVLSDLRERKKTLPFLAALAARSPASRELAGHLSASALDDAALARAAVLVEEAGGRRFTEREAEHHLTRGLACLDGVGLPEAARAEFRALIDFLAERTS